MTSDTVAPPRRVGRPALTVERREQIVGAFIELVAERGLEGVSLADVAAAAGVQQTAIRHFVGNRDELIVAAVDEVNRYFQDSDYAQATDTSDVAGLIRAIFSPAMHNNPYARAFAALEAEGTQHSKTRDAIRDTYEIFIDVIAAGLRRSYPGASEVRIRDAAYAITAMSRMSGDLQQLGFPRARATGAAKAAVALAEQLADG